MNNLDIKYNFKDGAKWDLPVYLNRQNPIPLDGTSIYNSYAEAEAYARENAKAYPGQIISVVTESEVKVYKINNGKLEELGKGSLVTDKNPNLLAKADNIGQIIYLTKDVKVTEGSGEVTYSSGPYIVSGNGTVSKIGTTPASGDIVGDVAALQGKVNTLDSTVGKKGSGDNASTGLVKNVEDLAKKDTELTDQINTLSGKVDKIKVEKANTPESESFAATYKFTDAAGNTVNINIPKDQFLKGVEYVADKPAEAEGNSAAIDFPALKFVWQFTNETITRTVTYISVKSLVDNYGIKKGELYLDKDESNNFYIKFNDLKTAIIGSETDENSVLGKIKDATDNAAAATTTAAAASTAATEAKNAATDATKVAGEAKTAADAAASTANTALETANNASTTAGEAKTTAGEAKTAAEQAKAAADANTTTLAGHTTSINDLTSKVDKNISDIATNAGNITKNADAIATNTTAINKNTAAIGTQAVVTPANIHIVGTPGQPAAPEGGTATAVYYLADGAGKELTEADIKKGGIYYIYKRETIETPDKDRPGEFNTRITISLVRQATSGAEGDFTYPSITTHSTGLYQYIDNHIKNFDLSWQILD